MLQEAEGVWSTMDHATSNWNSMIHNGSYQNKARQYDPSWIHGSCYKQLKENTQNVEEKVEEWKNFNKSIYLFLGSYSEKIRKRNKPRKNNERINCNFWKIKNK